MGVYSTHCIRPGKRSEENKRKTRDNIMLRPSKSIFTVEMGAHIAKKRRKRR